MSNGRTIGLNERGDKAEQEGRKRAMHSDLDDVNPFREATQSALSSAVSIRRVSNVEGFYDLLLERHGTAVGTHALRLITEQEML